jgi:hypothetical protein
MAQRILEDSHSLGQEGYMESSNLDCIQKWFKCIKMVTRILEDTHWVGLKSLVIVQLEQHSKMAKSVQIYEKRIPT